MPKRDYYVEVCEACLRASCWHGDDLCSEARGAKTIKRWASELRELCMEHPSNYSHEKLLRVCGGVENVRP